MRVLSHRFCFLGHLSQNLYPDLFLTTTDGGGEVVPAHRVVISAVSSKLAVLCKEGGKVVVRNISFHVLEKVVRFIYSGKIDLGNMEEVEDVRDGMDMLKVNIDIEKEDIINRDLVTYNEAVKEDRDTNSREERDRKDYEDHNANIVVENSYSLSEELSLSKELWAKNKKVKVENDLQSNSLGIMNIVKLNQDTSVTASDDASDDDKFVTSFSKILDSFTNVKKSEKDDHNLRLSKKNEIQKSEVECEYCSEKLIYRKYMKHCKINHPNSPWKTRTTCGTCRNGIPDVSLKYHMQVFHHKDVYVNQSNDHEDVETESINNDEPKKISKGQTKVPCDYCEEQVSLATYVSHCKKLHSISDADERCRRKCYKCGAKVHIVAEKFHDEIYHPPKPKHIHGKPEPLKIVEHNKHLTKVQCDYCGDKIVFGAYKAHVKNKHPEIAYAELVKCSKCGCKVPRISFKFHRQIFHNSSKLKSHPITNASLKLKFPQAKVPCALCSERVKPHIMFWHMKTVHGGEANTDQDAVVTTESCNEQENITKQDISEVKSMSEDVGFTGEGRTAPQESGLEEENAVLRVLSEQLSSDTSFEEMVLDEDPVVEANITDIIV